jgi:hypothetical protein
MPMPQMPMPQGMPPQGGQPPMPQGMNPNMMQFMQMLQAQGYSPQSNLQGAPQQPQGGPSMPPQGAGAPMPQPVQPNAQGGQQPVQPPMMQPRPIGPPNAQNQVGRQYTPQELAAMGRMGDNAVAHLTKGEVTIPPQVQSPKVLATVNKEMHKKGVDLSQFTVGSPNVSQNPNTGLPEQSFWSALLPILGGVAGSFIPGLGTGIGAAIGSGLGGMAGGMANGDSLTQSLGEGALGAAGSYGGSYLGGLIGGPSATDAINSTQPTAMQNAGSGMSYGGNTVGANSADAAFLKGGDAAAAFNPSVGPTMQNAASLGSQTATAAPQSLIQRAGSGLGGALGSSIGHQMFAPGNSATLPAGFNKPYTPPGQNPSAQTQLGYNTTKQPQASFAGYNPLSNNPYAYNFFPTQSNGA